MARTALASSAELKTTVQLSCIGGIKDGAFISGCLQQWRAERLEHSKRAHPSCCREPMLACDVLTLPIVASSQGSTALQSRPPNRLMSQKPRVESMDRIPGRELSTPGIGLTPALEAVPCTAPTA